MIVISFLDGEMEESGTPSETRAGGVVGDQIEKLVPRLEPCQLPIYKQYLVVRPEDGPTVGSSQESQP